MATEYRLHSVSRDDEGIHARLMVGKRAKFDRISLTQSEAFRLMSELMIALRDKTQEATPTPRRWPQRATVTHEGS